MVPVGVGRWVAIAAAAALHGLILAPILFQFDFGPREAPEEKEIPVELVVEPPKPPPAPAPPQPSMPPPQLDLKPAHDAPRDASDDKQPLAGDVAKTNGEKAPTPDAPKSSPTPAQTDQPSQAAKADAPAPATPSAAAKEEGGEEKKASDDAPTLSVPPAAELVAPDPKNEVATMMGEPLPTWSKAKQYSTFEPVPDAQFLSAGASPVGGGQAATTYMTVVYGLVIKHLRLSGSIQFPHAEGAIDFLLDGQGGIIERSVAQPSGSNELDAAALEAVREGAPYPAPPLGLPIGLRFTYGAK